MNSTNIVRMQKQFILDEVSIIITNFKYLAIYQHNAINGAELAALRACESKLGFKCVVVKNTYAAKVLQRTKFSNLLPVIEGPLLFVYSNQLDANKTLYKIQTLFPKLFPIAGIFQNALLSASHFSELNSIPTNYNATMDLIAQLNSPGAHISTNLINPLLVVTHLIQYHAQNTIQSNFVSL